MLLGARLPSPKAENVGAETDADYQNCSLDRNPKLISIHEMLHHVASALVCRENPILLNSALHALPLPTYGQAML